MAALTLSKPSLSFSLSSFTPRALQPYLARPAWSIPCEASSSSSSSTPTAIPNPVLSATYGHSTVVPWYTPFLPALSSITDLFPAILRAVPKRKTNPSRKGMRNSHSALKNRTNFSNCPACGMVTLTHNLCPRCFSAITRQWKAEARGEDVTKRFEPKKVLQKEDVPAKQEGAEA